MLSTAYVFFEVLPHGGPRLTLTVTVTVALCIGVIAAEELCSVLVGGVNGLVGVRCVWVGWGLGGHAAEWQQRNGSSARGWCRQRGRGSRRRGQ